MVYPPSKLMMSVQEAREAIAREKEIEKNKREAVEAAASIFKIVTNPSFANQLNADQRHQVCVEKNKGFAQAFPLVLSKMARDFAYSEKAFRRFLDKLHKDPGKGMDGIIERQADYAGYLYEELCRANGKHVNTKTRRDIWQTEYQQMYQWMKDIKKQEKKAKSELDEESKKSLEERKNELLEFLNENEPISAPLQTLDEMMHADEGYVNMLRAASDAPAQPEEVQASLESNLEFPTYSGYAEVQTPTELSSDVTAALEQRQKAMNKNDWLSDSNVPGWKQKKSKNKRV